MKKGSFALVAALATLFLAKPAEAGIGVQTFTGRVTATAANDFGVRVVCSGNVYGITNSGQTYYAYMNNIVLAPGQYAFVFVTTNPYNDPFVRGWSDIACVAY